LTTYKKIVEIDPNNVIAMNNVAWILSSDYENYEEALQWAERGLALSAKYADLLDTHGYICYKLGEYRKAIESLLECIRLYPRDAPAGVGSRFYLARSYIKLGNAVEGMTYLRQCLDLHNQVGGLSAQQLAEANQLLKGLAVNN